MNSDYYFERMKIYQENLLYFLENDSNNEENFQNFILLLDDLKSKDNQQELRSLLHLIHQISNNHYRWTNFFRKIEKIILFLKDIIKKNFTNSEIFNIFKSNKRILLFLIEEQIMIIDNFIVEKFITQNKYMKKGYLQYFSPEIRPFINDYWINSIKEYRFKQYIIKQVNEELPNNFNDLRKIGENNSLICKIIRNDSIQEFIKYVNENHFSLEATIEQSIYETNPFLIKNLKTTLIEYAAFFGSRQIFKYLESKDVKMKPSLCFYAIHGNDIEIIDSLIKNDIFQPDSFYQSFIQSITCHHNDLAFYILNNYLENENENLNTIISSIKHYNFAFIQNVFDHTELFIILCKSDNSFLVKEFLKNKNIDINKTIFKKKNI